MKLGEPLLDKEGYARVLGTLRENTLVSEIRESAIACDLHRLRCMVEFGVFAAQPLLARLSPQVAQNAWADRCEAALAVMTNAQIRPSANSKGPGLAVLDIPGEARQFFSGLCLMISSQMDVMSRMPDDQSRTWPMVSQAMGLAAMLDEPEVLVHMIDTHPAVAVTPFVDTCMGLDPTRGFFISSLSEKNCQMNVTPLFCALAFSSTSCVQALIPSSADLPDLCGVSRPGKGTVVYDFQDALVYVQFPCKPDAMVPMMTHLLDKCSVPGGETEPIHKVLRETMEATAGGGHGLNVHLLPAMIKAGWVDLQPDRMYEKAVAYEHPVVINHFEGRVNWDRLMNRRKPGYSEIVPALETGRTAGIVAMIDQAKRAGREDAALHQFMRGTALETSPASALLNTAPGIEILPKLLAIGLKPDVPLVEGGTLHQKARQMSASQPQEKNPALDILNSFVARTKAHALIDEMDEPKAGHAPV